MRNGHRHMVPPARAHPPVARPHLHRPPSERRPRMRRYVYSLLIATARTNLAAAPALAAAGPELDFARTIEVVALGREGGGLT
jgi:hypothetical protein